MALCSSYCFYKSMRIVNMVVNVIGIMMIIYSLWLLKKWTNGISLIPTQRDVPNPWFIYVCLGIGIVVSLSTLSGHMVANCISKSTLAVYVISIFSLLLIQVGVVVTLLFRIDWESDIIEYIGGHYQSFQSFILFHLDMCRLITVLVLVAQISIVMLASALWVIAEELTIQSHITRPIDVTQSFLVDYNNSPRLDDQRCTEEILKAYMEGILNASLPKIRRNVVS